MVLDASGIASEECFAMWLKSRRIPSKSNPRKCFQRALSAHLTASDGRQPFSPEEEQAVLSLLRGGRLRPKPLGFRGLGYNEKLRMMTSPPSSRAPAPTSFSPGKEFVHVASLLLKSSLECMDTVACLGRMYMMVNKGWVACNRGAILESYASRALVHFANQFPAQKMAIFDLMAKDLPSSVLASTPSLTDRHLNEMLQRLGMCDKIELLRLLARAVENSGEEFELTLPSDLRLAVSVFSPERLLLVKFL
ncbi:hypothetical protein BASA81_006691 [Batrachochytrium salamandrivorans]|nr:hypothetical protein BASA81_006691 [Batrachochytrium salamandrivorans]